MNLIKLLKHDVRKNSLLIPGYVKMDSARCVKNTQCLTCGECAVRCLLDTTRFAETDIFSMKAL